MFYRIAKRLLDLAVVLLASPIALPLIAFGALASAVAHRSNPFFNQIRTGQDGQELKIFKLKTMLDMRDGLIDDADRLTRTGQFLRKTSIDELPQLWNVLCGNMSIVGPRPQIRRYSDMMTVEEFRRHDVKPGITGWAQINGLRGETDTPEKMRRRVEYDLHYIDNWSLLFDLRILFLTLFVGFVNRNAY